MKELLRLPGGYKRIMDFILSLQAENLTLGNSLFAKLGFDMVLSGCDVVDNGNGTINIAPGIIYISREALRFDGANNIVIDGSKAFAKGGYVTTDPKLFGDGSTKNVYREAKAVIVNSTVGNISEIKIELQLYGLKQYIEDVVQANEVKGTIKEIYDFDGTFAANFDVSGLGITSRWLGWALDNGNNGTPGSAGMALVGVGKYTEPDTGEETIYNPGDKSGKRSTKLTTGQAPIPAGLVNELDGPHRKPADGGGDPLYYVKSLKGSSAATDALVLMNPNMAVYRIIKIV